MRGWRVPLILTAILAVAQLFRTGPLIDVASGTTPTQVQLAYPFAHALFAPFTLAADYLNGGSVRDLTAFAAWAILVFVLARLGARAGPGSRLTREIRATAFFLGLFGLFIWWGARWQRPIARLVASDSTLIIFDTHSHTAASHDGRPGFGAAANAAWHARAGFDAAFVTDHNVFGAARQWQHDRGGHPPRLLDGEELSLAGLHLVVLGNHTLIDNRPGAASFDSTLALIARLARDSAYLIASLPEYWEHHWGRDVGTMITAGVSGLEIWTTSPKAMNFPPQLRQVVIDRARTDSVGLFGATDMHGLGYAASVWNVTALPGWRALSDSALARALIVRFRRAPTEIRVVAIRRAQPITRLGRGFAVPLGLWTILRSATPWHLASLLGWIWIPAWIRSRRARR